MGWLAFLFFSFRGRISRASWWFGEGVLLAVGFLISFAESRFSWQRFTEESASSPSLLEFAVGIALAIPTFALIVKRLNDRNYPKWIGPAFFIASFVLSGAIYFELALQSKELGTIDLLIATAFLPLFAWLTIDNGFLRGTVGPNSYGPDPVRLASGAAGTPLVGSQRSLGSYFRDGVTILLFLTFALALASHLKLTDLPDRMMRKLLYPRNLTVMQERRDNKPAYQAFLDGAAANKAGDHQAAIAHFSRAIELYGPDTDTAAHSYRLRAQTRRRTGDLGGALADYNHVVRLEPESWSYGERGWMHHKLQRYAEALSDYDTALAKSPGTASYLTGRGSALARLGRQSEALAAYDEALKAASQRLDTNMQRLETDEYVKKDAAVWQRRYRDWYEDDVTGAHLGRANSLRDLGRFDEALAEYGEAIAIRPSAARGYLQRGWYFEKQGQNRGLLLTMKKRSPWVPPAIG